MVWLRFHSRVLFVSILSLVSPVVTSARDPKESLRESSSPELLVGMSTALTGPTAHLGLAVQAGVESAFEEFNASQSTLPRLRLVALDDGYEPSRTGPNMHQLIEQMGAVAILGNVGAPCAVSAVPIANATRTPLIGYVTGGSVLRKTPPDRYVINYRASLAEEAGALVRNLVEQASIAPDEIAFFTQRDTFGDSYFDSGIAELKRLGLAHPQFIIHSRYERNTIAVQTAVSEILLASKPVRAVVIGGAGAPAEAFIRTMRQAGYNGILGAVSFVEASRLAENLGDLGNDVIVTQVVPHVQESSPIVERFRRALGESHADMQESEIALEGYIIANLFCFALSHIHGPIDRESLADALLTLEDFDLGLETPLFLNDSQHQACHTIWPSKLRQGKVLPMQWKELATGGAK